MSARNPVKDFMRLCAIAVVIVLGGCAVYTPGPQAVYVRQGPVYVQPAPYYYGPYYGPYYRHPAPRYHYHRH